MPKTHMRKILIVDDNPDNIRVLIPLLMNYQEFQINVAFSGKEALETLEKLTPDLILMDIMMPEMDGLEACTIIKQQERLINTPVIFITAKTDTEDLSRAFDAGAADFLTKPFNSIELISRVKTHLELKISRDLLQTKLENLVAQRTAELEKETQQKLKLQEQLLRAQKLEALGLLSSCVAHDFNNQLSTILCCSEGLKMISKDADIHEFADLITQAGQSAASLTKKLLSFAKTGKSLNNTSPIEINTLIENTINSLRLPTHIQVSSSLHKNNLFLLGEQTLLENALLNIAINATQAMPNGGKINISTSVDSNEIPTNVIINISDTGTGMSPDTKKLIFEPFFTTKNTSNSAGIGLASTFDTIQKHNGSIDVETELGEGSTFIINLPLFKPTTEFLSMLGN